MVPPVMFFSAGKPGINISSDESYLSSEITFKLSVRVRLPVRVKADTEASPDPDVVV